jgi:hypothetical protein
LSIFNTVKIPPFFFTPSPKNDKNGGIFTVLRDKNGGIFTVLRDKNGGIFTVLRF